MTELSAEWKRRLIELLERNYGYEFVNQLLDADMTRRELIDAVETDGSSVSSSTTDEWVLDAIEAGLLDFYAVKNGRRLEVKLTLRDEAIPQGAIPIIRQRGTTHRDDSANHANRANISKYVDNYDIRDRIL